jgi:hypothetical protein
MNTVDTARTSTIHPWVNIFLPSFSACALLGGKPRINSSPSSKSLRMVCKARANDGHFALEDRVTAGYEEAESTSFTGSAKHHSDVLYLAKLWSSPSRRWEGNFRPNLYLVSAFC